MIPGIGWVILIWFVVYIFQFWFVYDVHGKSCIWSFYFYHLIWIFLFLYNVCLGSMITMSLSFNGHFVYSSDKIQFCVIMDLVQND